MTAQDPSSLPPFARCKECLFNTKAIPLLRSRLAEAPSRNHDNPSSERVVSASLARSENKKPHQNQSDPRKRMRESPAVDHCKPFASVLVLCGRSGEAYKDDVEVGARLGELLLGSRVESVGVLDGDDESSVRE